MPQITAINYPLAILLFTNAVYLPLGHYTSFEYLSLEGLFYVFSYISLSVYFSALVSVIPQKVKAITGVILSIITLINIEHILVNNAHINFAHYEFLFHPQFLKSLFNPSFLRKLLYITTLFSLSLFISTKIKVELKPRLMVSLTLILLFFDFFFPRSLSVASWQQYNPVVDKLSINKKTNFLSTQKQKEINIIQELDGKSILSKKPNPKPNIIMIILEGFSDNFINLGLTPNLKRIAEKSLRYTSFINNQMQTNRGLYSLFCNDYPNLFNNVAKSDLLSSALFERECFPQFLRKKGYQNYFIQSAPLSFMRKDLFAKAAGFHYALGADSFEKDKQISPWGVGDDTLFEALFKIIKEKKEQQSSPYFISALTVGTHHPYITPLTKGSLVSAIRYTDDIVGRLYDLLLEHKLLDNTLLIVTSDESKLLSSKFPLIHSNWGMMLVYNKDIDPTEIETPFSQVDLSLSIADYLGEGNNSPYKGRSLFREYQDHRNIYFANLFNKRIYLQESKERYHICNFSFECMSVKSNKHLFDTSPKLEKFNSPKKDQIVNFVISNDRDYSEYKYIFKEENIHLKPNENKAIFQEYKFTNNKDGELEIVFYINDYDQKEIGLEFSHYICGNAASLKQESASLKLTGKKTHFKFKLPNNIHTYCLGLNIKNTKNDLTLNSITMKRYEK